MAIADFIDRVLEKKISLKDLLKLIIPFVLSFTFIFIIMLVAIIITLGQSVIIELSKIFIEVSGIILGFSFIAIASLLKPAGEMKLISRYFMGLLLDVVEKFIFVLICSLIVVFLTIIPENVILFTYGNTLVNRTPILVFIFTYNIVFLAMGFYSLIISLSKIDKYLMTSKIRKHIEKNKL